MDYQIQITESLQRVATVSADSEIEAIELVRRLYKEEKIVLDSEDFTDANFIVKNQNLKTYYQSEKRDFVLAHGDCFKLLNEFDFKFDMIFADHHYFLSNGGI